MRDSNCGIYLILFILVIIALFSNPSLENGKKKIEGDTSYRSIIKDSDVRLYRAGYFVFSEYYLTIDSGSPVKYGIGIFGVILETEDKGLNTSGKFDESVKLE